MTDCDENKDDIDGDNFSVQLDLTLVGLLRTTKGNVNFVKVAEKRTPYLPSATCQRNAHRGRTGSQACAFLMLLFLTDYSWQTISSGFKLS